MFQKTLILIVFSIFFVNLKAQKKYEVSASYGTPSSYGLAYDFFDSIFNSSEDSNSNKVSGQGVAAVGIGVYSPNQKWRFELGLMNEFFNDEKSSVTTDANFFSIHPNVKYMWRKPERKFQIYSGAGLGITFMEMNSTDRTTGEKLKDKSSVLTWNLTYFGLRYGKNYGVFTDFNIGIQSITQFGLFYRF